MQYSNYGEVINHIYTYREIASMLLKDDTVFIGWTDEDCTHLDIMFNLGVKSFGSIQRGIKKEFLFVSIIGHTSYGFKADTIKDGNYIQEKLRMNNSCGDKLKELINGIIIELQELCIHEKKLTSTDKLIKENELLHEEVSELKNAIINTYDVMMSLDTINNYEITDEDIEVI